MISADRVQSLIQAGLPEATVLVEDPMNDGTHLTATVVAPAFEGMSRMQQHRAVYRALGDAFDQALHALQLTTLTPSQARERGLTP